MIDEIDKLSNAEVIERRRTEVYAAQAKSIADRREHELALEAAEYVASYRHLAPLKPYCGVDNPGIHRLDIRVALEEGIRQHHSFNQAFLADWEKSFRYEFKRQAYWTAYRMLDGSLERSSRCMKSYGILVQAAKAAGSRLSHDDSRLKEEAASGLGAMKASPDVNTYNLFYVDPALRRMPQPEAMGRR